MLYTVLHLLPIKKRSHLNCQGVGALALEEALGLAEESCVGLAYAGDIIVLLYCIVLYCIILYCIM